MKQSVYIIENKTKIYYFFCFSKYNKFFAQNISYKIVVNFLSNDKKSSYLWLHWNYNNNTLEIYNYHYKIIYKSSDNTYFYPTIVYNLRGRITWHATLSRALLPTIIYIIYMCINTAYIQQTTSCSVQNNDIYPKPPTPTYSVKLPP